MMMIITTVTDKIGREDRSNIYIYMCVCVAGSYL